MGTQEEENQKYFKPVTERVKIDYEEELHRKLDQRGRGLTDYDIEQICDHGDRSLKNKMEKIADERQLKKQYYERTHGIKVTGFTANGEPYSDMALDFNIFKNS